MLNGLLVFLSVFFFSCLCWETNESIQYHAGNPTHNIYYKWIFKRENLSSSWHQIIWQWSAFSFVQMSSINAKAKRCIERDRSNSVRHTSSIFLLAHCWVFAIVKKSIWTTDEAAMRLQCLRYAVRCVSALNMRKRCPTIYIYIFNSDRTYQYTPHLHTLG